MLCLLRTRSALSQSTAYLAGALVYYTLPTLSHRSLYIPVAFFKSIIYHRRPLRSNQSFRMLI